MSACYFRSATNSQTKNGGLLEAAENLRLPKTLIQTDNPEEHREINDLWAESWRSEGFESD